jgi:hypothetical protein
MNINVMRNVILAGLMTILFGCSEIPKKNDNVGRELLALEKDFLDKEFALDTAYLSSLMDSTFIDIADDGVKHKKEDLISIYNNIDQRIKSGIAIDSFKLENEIVNVYPNSAVVVFIVHSFRHSGDTLVERRTRFYDVWTKRGDHWKLVASQGTAIEN